MKIPQNLNKLVEERFVLSSPGSRKDFGSLAELSAFVSHFLECFPDYDFTDYSVCRLCVYVSDESNNE